MSAWTVATERVSVSSTSPWSIDLAIPPLHEVKYLPSFLEHRTRIEQALLALVQEAFVGGVSTRNMAKLVTALVEASNRSRNCT